MCPTPTFAATIAAIMAETTDAHGTECVPTPSTGNDSCGDNGKDGGSNVYPNDVRGSFTD